MALAIKGRPFALVGSKQSACKSSPPFLYFILPQSYPSLIPFCFITVTSSSFFLNQEIPSRLHLKLKICLVVKEPTENQNDIPLPPLV